MLNHNCEELLSFDVIQLQLVRVRTWVCLKGLYLAHLACIKVQVEAVILTIPLVLSSHVAWERKPLGLWDNYT